MTEFSRAETIRYSRHFVLPDFGPTAQLKLKQSSVLVVGAGGLGCPVLQYLVAAGVGKIGVIDNDEVSLSNLQRQILYTIDDLHQNKAITACKKLSKLNPEVIFESYASRITSDNALEIIRPYQILIDCTDNFPTRYLINDACEILKIPFVYGSIFRYEGQVSLFNVGNASPSYRDLFPEPPPPNSVPNCEQGGVLGVLAGIIGCYQANETIKWITGLGETLSGRLLIFDAWSCETRVLNIKSNPNRTIIKELIDYESYCGIDNTSKSTTMAAGVNEITVEELKSLKDSGEDFQLIDVREPYEYDIANLGGELIPLATIANAADKIARDKKVIVHCRSGARSANAIAFLQENFDFDNLYNLAGGILAYADRIDNSLTKY